MITILYVTQLVRTIRELTIQAPTPQNGQTHLNNSQQFKAFDIERCAATLFAICNHVLKQ